MELLKAESCYVQARSARAIANLAKNSQNWTYYAEKNIVGQLLDMLIRSRDVDLQDCGLRALSVFLTNRSSRRQFFDRNGVKYVVECLGSRSPIVAVGALRVVETMSARQNDELAKQLAATDDGFDRLLKLLASPKPKIQMSVARCLSLWAESVPQVASRAELGALLAEAKLTTNDALKRLIVFTLCTLCRHAWCRLEMAKDETLRYLVQVLGDDDMWPYHHNVLSGLICYYYDEDGLRNLVDLGIVSILAKRLGNILDYTVRRDDKARRSREQQSPALSPSPLAQISPSSSPPHFSLGSASPSPQTSPFSSPPRGCVQVSPSSSPLLSTSPQSDLDVTAVDSARDAIVKMLYKICLIKTCVPAFLRSNILRTLVRCVAGALETHSQAFRILSRLFDLSGCFEHVVTLQTPSLVHRRLCLHRDERQRCEGKRLMRFLQIKTESEYGQGVIEHTLLRGSERERKAFLISMPYVCKQKSVCRKLFIKHKWIESVINILRQSDDEEDDENDDSVTINICGGFSVLAKTLLAEEEENVEPLKKVRRKDSAPFVCRSDTLSATEQRVELKLDGGEVVTCCAEALIKCSDYFEAMLTGSFRESALKLDRISLPGVSYASLFAVVHWAQGCSWKCAAGKGEGETDANGLDFALDVMSLANKFLMNDLKDECQWHAARQLSTENVVDVFYVACTHDAELLANQCCLFWLRMDDFVVQWSIFKGWIDNAERENVFKAIHCLFTSALTSEMSASEQRTTH